MEPSLKGVCIVFDFNIRYTNVNNGKLIAVINLLFCDCVGLQWAMVSLLYSFHPPVFIHYTIKVSELRQQDDLSVCYHHERCDVLMSLTNRAGLFSMLFKLQLTLLI